MVAIAIAPVILALAPATPAGAVAAWRTLPSKPTPAYFLGAGAGARVYAVGGYNNNGYLNQLEKYDPASNIWSTLAPMPTPRGELAVAAFNGRVYAVGGYNHGYLNTLEAYNPSTNTWATLAPMPTAREDLAAVAVPCRGASGTCLDVIGGWNGTALATVEQYNPANNTWSTLASMPTPRFDLAAAAGSHIYAVGGYNGGYLNVLEQYNPPTDTWATLAPMPTPREALGAAAFNGNVYALGGDNATGNLATFERYNVSSNTWATLTSMPTAREELAVVAAPCPGSSTTCVYGIGGYTSGPVGTMEAYG